MSSLAFSTFLVVASGLLRAATTTAFTVPASTTQPIAAAAASAAAFHSRRTSPLHVSIGLGPGKDDDEIEDAAPTATAEQEAEEAELVQEPDHELYRTSRLTKLDRVCDDWYGSLLGSEDDGQKFMFLGQVSEEARRRIMTLPELRHEPKLESDDVEWTPYQLNVLPSSPILPAFGLEQYGLPTPRKNAETWRRFDVSGMVETDYSGVPEGIGTHLELSDELATHYKAKLVERGAWLDDVDCTARLVYVNGRYCPALSMPTDSVRNLSKDDFNGEAKIRDELMGCLNRLPDGFTDELAAEVPSGDKGDVLTSLAKLSGPDHNVGDPTGQFAINNQQGTACFAALNSVRAGAVALVDIPPAVGAAGGANEDKEGADDDNEEEEEEEPKPVLIINAQTADMGCGNDLDEGKGVACHPRALAVVGEGQNVALVQSVVDLDDDDDDSNDDSSSASANNRAKLHNGYTQIFVKGGANLTHSYLEETGGLVTSGVENTDQDNKDGDDTTPDPREVEAARPALRNTHLETIDVHVTGDGGTYTGSVLGLSGNGRTRTAVSAHLLRPGSHATLNGFVLAGGTQRTETKTNIHHVAQGTTSAQVQRNMVGGRATSSFRGRIRVEQSAQQTDSDQLSRTVLLSERARIWTVPSLEIIADDVKCTHGATVSDLSEEELFYLRSRGVDRETARNILMYAFVDEVSRAVPRAVRGSDDDDAGLKRRCIRRLQNVVPQGDRAVKGEFQSV